MICEMRLRGIEGKIVLNVLTQLFSVKTADLEAKLRGVAGFTGYGEVEFAAFSSGKRCLEVEVRGAAGLVADVYINDEKVGAVSLNKGRADEFFDTRHGHSVPDLSEGDKVEIRQNGQVILEGVLAQD